MTEATQRKMNPQAQETTKIADVLETLRRSFRAGLDDRICRIETARIAFSNGSTRAADALATIESEAHRIRGVAGSLGLPAIGTQAAALETIVAEAAKAPAQSRDKAALDAHINGFLDLLEQELTDE